MFLRPTTSPSSIWPAPPTCPTLRGHSPSRNACTSSTNGPSSRDATPKLAYEQSFRKNPDEYAHSEAYFRSLCLATVLQRHCGLHYNPAKIPEDVPLETTDTFIHGAILGEGGTCASIPVVLAAVGRRLGYPIKIAETKGVKWGHVFARWDDPGGERLNLEVAGRGLNTYDDDYYRTGRYALDAETEKAGQFLKSMTPREELANFLAERALHWRRYGRWRFMAEAYAWAVSLAPANAYYRNMLNVATNGWLDEQKKRKPPGFPEVFLEPLIRHFPLLPLEKEQQILGRCWTASCAIRNWTRNIGSQCGEA
jgi:hypothetical protein